MCVANPVKNSMKHMLENPEIRFLKSHSKLEIKKLQKTDANAEDKNRSICYNSQWLTKIKIKVVVQWAIIFLLC